MKAQQDLERLLHVQEAAARLIVAEAQIMGCPINLAEARKLIRLGDLQDLAHEIIHEHHDRKPGR